MDRDHWRLINNIVMILTILYTYVYSIVSIITILLIKRQWIEIYSFREYMHSFGAPHLHNGMPFAKNCQVFTWKGEKSHIVRQY